MSKENDGSLTRVLEVKFMTSEDFLSYLFIYFSLINRKAQTNYIVVTLQIISIPKMWHSTVTGRYSCHTLISEVNYKWTAKQFLRPSNRDISYAADREGERINKFESLW